MQQALCCQTVAAGGLKMLKVQDSVNLLRVKWMLQLWKDKGQTWSCFAWCNVLITIPKEIIPGMTCLR